MAEPSLAERLARPGPKRLLALDGGGLRGAITLGYLGRIQGLLRQRYGRSDLVLSDYFDLIGGTSTGAIIAAGLALGRSVEEIHELYVSLGRDAFRPRRSFLGPVGRLLGARFDERPLERILQSNFEDRRLDSPELRTGLVIVVKRADTGSVWPVVNIPTQRFWESNRRFRLWEVVSASAAAPTYFRPRRFSDVGDQEEAVFVDGGVSMHNRPALQLLMVASLSGFGLRWPHGEDRLLLCSVGTGQYDHVATPAQVERYTNVHWLAHLTVQMIHDAGELSQTMLQWMSRSPTARPLDRQIDALEGDVLGGKPLLWYLRYDVELNAPALQALGLPFDEAKAKALQDMSDVTNLDDLDRLGQVAAEHDVRSEHFPARFDPVSGATSA